MRALTFLRMLLRAAMPLPIGPWAYRRFAWEQRLSMWYGSQRPTFTGSFGLGVPQPTFSRNAVTPSAHTRIAPSPRNFKQWWLR